MHIPLWVKIYADHNSKEVEIQDLPFVLRTDATIEKGQNKKQEVYEPGNKKMTPKHKIKRFPITLPPRMRKSGDN